MKKKTKKVKKIVKTKKIKSVKVQTRQTKPAPKNLGKFKHFQNMLISKREDILNTSKEKNVDTTYGEIGDEADVASQTFEREMMFEMTNGERMILDDVEAALRKIEKGEFSICESCHKKISSVRLNAMPWARHCIECQSRAETSRS